MKGSHTGMKFHGFFLLIEGYTMSGTPIIPCLDTQSLLVDPRDILSYVLRYYTTAPKSVSDTTPYAMISLADDISRYQDNQNNLSRAVTTALQSVYTRFFDPGTTSVDVSTSDNGDGSYNLTIQLSVGKNGVPYTLGANVAVSNNGILQLKYHPSLN